MKKFPYFLFILVSFFSCDTQENDNINLETPSLNSQQILYLQVKYTDQTFMGGTILESPTTDSLTTTYNYVTPSDFGSIKIMEQNTSTLLFEGNITWLGLGERFFPETLQSPENFSFTISNDFVTPPHFDNMFPEIDPTFLEHNYESAWASLQSLVWVREKLRSRPDLHVKYFLYTPSVGVGNPEDWYWIFLLK